MMYLVQAAATVIPLAQSAVNCWTLFRMTMLNEI